MLQLGELELRHVPSWATFSSAGHQSILFRPWRYPIGVRTGPEPIIPLLPIILRQNDTTGVHNRDKVTPKQTNRKTKKEGKKKKYKNAEKTETLRPRSK